MCATIMTRYPDRDELTAIYSAYLRPVLAAKCDRHPVWGSPSKINALASSMGQVYEQVKSR